MTSRWAGRVQRSVAVLGLVLILTSCGHVHLIAPYDEPTDRLLTEFARETDRFFDHVLELTPTYAQSGHAYATMYGDLRVIRLRAAARPKNETTLAMLDVIRTSWGRVEAQHKLAGHLSLAFIEEVRDLLARQIGDAIGLEIDKRRAAP